MTPVDSLSTRLRDATQKVHEDLESFEFFQALRNHSLSRQSAISYLRGLAVIHALLCTAITNPGLNKFTARQRERSDDLLKTLENAGAESLPDIPQATEAALQLGDQLLLATPDQASLLGACYVLEGSQLGGQILRDHLARTLGLRPVEVAYHAASNKTVRQRWDAFRQELDQLDLTDEQARSVIRTAIVTFDGIGALARAAHPFNPETLRHRISAINPEAGRHAMPTREVDIARALRCGAAAWQRYPYLEMRYGDRGRRFTSSDSCWLVSLYDLDELLVIRNLQWLCKVLASRGLPTVILEDHLRKIDQDVAIHEPERWRTSTGFRTTLEQLLVKRGTHLSHSRHIKLMDEWRPRFDSCTGSLVPDAVALLISARLDTASGIERAWEASRSWFTDPKIFSSQWIETVNALGSALEDSLQANDPSPETTRYKEFTLSG